MGNAHDLRHFYASALIRSGLPVKVVQARLGHASAKTTLDVCGHLFPDEEDRTRQAIEAAFNTEPDAGYATNKAVLVFGCPSCVQLALATGETQQLKTGSYMS
jgi:hypothetical protein